MAHLIDKDALVAKIEKLMYAANLEADIASTGECFNEDIADAKYQLCKYILSFLYTLEVIEIGVDLGDPEGDKSAKYIIDTKTLEVKEVDLEKIYQKGYNDAIKHCTIHS